MTFAKKCTRCQRATKSAGTVCRECKRALFPGVDSLRAMMDRHRIPCGCGKNACAVIDFRPVCVSCRDAIRVADCNHRKDWREARGFCRECTAPAAEGFKHCLTHLEQGRKRAATSRGRNLFEQRERMKCAAFARVASGKCRSCTRPHLPERTLCAVCRDKVALKQRAKYHARTGSRTTLDAMESLYGHRADALDPRGDFGLGADFTAMAQLSHAYQK